MTKHVRHWAPLTLALVMLPLCLVACQVPSIADATGKIRTIAISTSDGSSSTPLPPLSPLTMGIWASTDAPPTQTPTPHAGTQVNISATIYILCTLHDPASGQQLGPAAGLSLRMHLSGPITQSSTGTTGGNGLAQFHLDFAEAQPSKPLTVNVSATWNGVTYQGQSVFVFGDDSSTPSPSPSTSPTIGPEPTTATTPEPTSTTAPEPTSTTAPEPTSTTVPEPTSTTVPEPTATDTPEPSATTGP